MHTILHNWKSNIILARVRLLLRKAASNPPIARYQSTHNVDSPICTSLHIIEYIFNNTHHSAHNKNPSSSPRCPPPAS